MPQIYKKIDRTKPVAYLQGDGNYTTIHYPDGTTALASLTFKLIRAWYPDIIQVRKGVAVNPKYIVSYNRYSVKGLRVHLEFAGTRIVFEASRRSVDRVERAILVYRLTHDLQDYQIE